MKKLLLIGVVIGLFTACNEPKFDESSTMYLKSGNGKAVGQNPITFSFLSKYDIGGEGAAEISAFDPLTNKLFVVDNSETSQIVVLDLTNPGSPLDAGAIDVSGYGGGVNSVAVKNGMLAAAIEADPKTDDGVVVVFNTETQFEIQKVGVGALPDMVTFTPDGNYILSANEGEPNFDYTIDPIGSVSVISVADWSVTPLYFSSFAVQQDALMAKGFRIFGLNATFEQDIEPEYITVSEDSKTAWVSLQENNALAKVDIENKTITELLPLGFKDYSRPQNTIDVSDEDDVYMPDRWPVYGIYEPDGIAVMTENGIPYVFTANEGDSRDYQDEDLDTVYFVEEARVKDIDLDPEIFPDADLLQKKTMMGRLKITTTLGNTDNDGEYEELYSYGARSFSVWDGNTGDQIFDSRDELDIQAVINGLYDDGRSDDKSIEPEATVVGSIGNVKLLFVGMERANSVAVYDVTNPGNPKYLQWLSTGAGPEGVIFVPAEESPSGENLLIVSSEVDGVVTIFNVKKEI